MQPTTNQTAPIPSNQAPVNQSPAGLLQPVVLDVEALRQISGGTSTLIPVNNW